MMTSAPADRLHPSFRPRRFPSGTHKKGQDGRASPILSFRFTRVPAPPGRSGPAFGEEPGYSFSVVVFAERTHRSGSRATLTGFSGKGMEKGQLAPRAATVPRR